MCGIFLVLFRTPGVDDSKGILLSQKTFPERERGKVSMNVMMLSEETWRSSHGTAASAQRMSRLGLRDGGEVVAHHSLEFDEPS